MRLGTPRSEQGQMVERAYGWHEGSYYMRVRVAGSDATMWYRATKRSADRLAETDYNAGGEIDPPPVRWCVRPCAAPDAAA